MNKKKQLIIFSVTTAFILISALYYVLQSGQGLVFTNSRVQNILIYPDDEEFYKNKKPVDLVFYFFGANRDESAVMESFSRGGLNLMDENEKYRKNLIFISFGYDTKFHWSSPDIAKDTIKSINSLRRKYNVNKIFFVGVSAGGSLALNVLSLADQKLQEHISAVISVFPIIDYKYTYENTKRQNISEYLKVHFLEFKEPDEYMKLSSPITYTSNIPSHTKIILIEGIKDTHVCSNQIEKYYENLKKLNKNVELMKFDTDHVLYNVDKEFGDLIKSVIG